MDNSGSSHNPGNLVFISPTLGPLTWLEERRLIKGRIVSIPRIGNILILANIDIKECCAKF
jgi:hypothetical protein